MARKNRSNNSFAPIVITVLVAGVVGYYAFMKSPPQSTLAEGDGQGGFAFERAPDSSAGKPSTGTASKLVGDSDTSGIFTPKSPLDTAGSKLVEPDRATPTLPEPQGGLRPDPIPESASKLSAPEVVTPTTPARPSDSSGVRHSRGGWFRVCSFCQAGTQDRTHAHGCSGTEAEACRFHRGVHRPRW